MVKIRRPTRGGNKLVTYGKCACIGGIVVLLFNLLLSRTGDHHHVHNSMGHEILQIQHDPSKQQQQEQPLRNLNDRKPVIPPQHHEHTTSGGSNQAQEAEAAATAEVGRKDSNLEYADADAVNNPAGRLSGDSKQDEELGGGGTTEQQQEPEQKIQYVSPNGEVLEKPEGTGPTKLGYVLDLVYERSHPTFRTESIQHIETSRQNHIQAVATALGDNVEINNVQPCEYLEDTTASTPRLLQKETCRRHQDDDSKLVVYNSATFPRTWCGVSILPNSAERISSTKAANCVGEPVRLFEQDFPPINGQGMSPIVVHSQVDGKIDDHQLKDVEDCTIPCQVEEGMTGIVRYIKGTDWNIFQSSQDPNSKREIQVELSKYKHDEYFSTAYFKSDVPLSRFDFSKHSFRNRAAVNFDETMDKGVYIVNEQCGATNSRRTRWLETLQNQYHVDSLGQCKHTQDVKPGESIDTLEGRLAIMKQYKFNLGFEISTHKDWVTELSYEAFLSGAVPIILGASNAPGKHFPRDGAIYTNDFNNWDKLAQHVNNVATNKALWDSYHTWRTDETILAALERKYQFTKSSPNCRLCSWAYAKMYGLGWDHELQFVQETHVPRKLCVDEDTTGLITSPFQEIWWSSSTLAPPSTASSSSCSSTPQSSTLDHKILTKDDWSITRSVVQHDSITDIIIHDIATSDEVILTLAFNDVNNTEEAFFRNSHTLVPTERGMLMSSATIQDHKSKVTVLANWETNVWSPLQGQLRVVVQGKKAPKLHADEVRRIRIISEDMGQLHDKMTEYFPSSFSKRMIKDFVDPLEVYYLDS